ncbi:hypothetical protein Mgra_00003297 [Meloidogyne graminicola]|uniref:Metalloendopeptidase n=1 Tax=Meloidogyne graminicola TaxID=189291 RepID=A0A8S9ZVS9_9BILA|nr:hypothetical protein Mgra_00003297 [Meloidogyne graminicola]
MFLINNKNNYIKNCLFLLSNIERSQIINKNTFLKKDQSQINIFELKAAHLYDLACNINEYKKNDKGFGIPNYTCRNKTGNENLLRDWNSSNLTLCYSSKLGDELKNNPKSDFAKSCSSKGSDKHGIEFRVYATRIGFERFVNKERYEIKYRIDVIIGFSYSEYTINFGKIIVASGKDLEDGWLKPLDYGKSPLLLSIKIGNSTNKFAILKDELNKKVYNFEEKILTNFENENIQQLVKEEGALAMIGPDMNLYGENMTTNNFEIFYVSQKRCDPILNLTLNKKGMYERYSCYKRPPNHCDHIGPEKYMKLKNAYDEYLDLKKKCPCKYDPRPAHIPESWVYPERNKRNIEYGLPDEDGLYPECENATLIAFGDRCRNSNSRIKRQLSSKSTDILWGMPVHYAFKTSYFDSSEWMERVEEGLKLISSKTCITFEKVARNYTKKHLLFLPYGGCGTNLGVNGFEEIQHLIEYTCPDAATASHEVMHALGFEHEMIRMDRNKYVWINFDDVDSDYTEQYYRLFSSVQYEQPYDFGSVMHYAPIYEGDERFSIIALFRDYQQTMGQRKDISFKDAKLLNRVYCTNSNPHSAVYADCDPYEYELNKGKCKNGGYPDPINKCKCRCPDGYSGNDCTLYKFKKCKVNELKATIKKQYITIKNISKECFWVIKNNEKDKILHKFIYINIEKLEGYKCEVNCKDICGGEYRCEAQCKIVQYPCNDNFIEIKYNKDKTATGARLCCGKRMMPIVIIAEADTEVLIMKNGIGKAVISYEIEHKSSDKSSNCKDVRSSILDMEMHPNQALVGYTTREDEGLDTGPFWGLICDNGRILIINSHYYVKKWGCITTHGSACGFIMEMFCKKVEGSEESNWYWESPEDGWILVSSISCHKDKDTERDKK